MKMQREVALASASRNLGDQALGLDSIMLEEGATILDIGCGPGVHLDYFRSLGLVGTGLDRDPDNFLFHGEIEHVTDPLQLGDRKFDYVFASHVLEHCPNTFEALASWAKFLKEGGALIIFVPPFWNEVSNDHWCTGWNVGQLAMTLVAAGFDCRESTFYQTSDQVFGFGIKRDIAPAFMITDSLPHLPPAIRQGFFQGDGWQNLRADIAFVRGDRIDYLPRRPASLVVPVPDDSWIRVSREGWDTAEATPLRPITRHDEFTLAIESEKAGSVRICFGHEGYPETAAAWFEMPVGLSIRHFVLSELVERTAGFEPSLTHHVTIGGGSPYVRAALFNRGERVV